MLASFPKEEVLLTSMPAVARAALLALCAAAPFPKPQQGLSLAPAATVLDLSPQEVTAPRFVGQTEEITVTAHRAPMQADPHAPPLRFRDTPQDLQAYDLWALQWGAPPCCQSPYETDIGGQPGRP